MWILSSTSNKISFLNVHHKVGLTQEWVSVFKKLYKNQQCNSFLSKVSTASTTAKNAKEWQQKHHANLSQLLFGGNLFSLSNLKFSSYKKEGFETSNPSGIISQRSNYIKLLKSLIQNEPQFLQNTFKNLWKQSPIPLPPINPWLCQDFTVCEW